MPIAIVAAGALVGLGLFFGLRSRPDPPPAAAPPAAPGTTSISAPLPLGPPDPAPASSATPVTPPATASNVDRKATAGQARAALDQHKKKIVEACILPALAAKPTPPNVKLSFNFSFDASGKQLTRGISEDRETGRPGITQCVQSKLPAIQIPPPGAGVFVEGIEWVLP